MSEMPGGGASIDVMSASWKHRLAELGKFLTVGGVATVVSLIIFNVLVHGVPNVLSAPMPNQPIFAYVLANTVGMLISFSGSRNWAFSDRESSHRDGGFTAYVVINMATFVLPMACLWISRDVLGRTDPLSDNIAANIIGGVLGTAARYYLFRTLVFRRPVPLVDMHEELGESLDENSTLLPVAGAVSRPDGTSVRPRGLVRPDLIRLGSRAMARRARVRRPVHAPSED